MVKKSQVVFELNMAKVMPVADPLVVREVLLENKHLFFGWDILISGAGFDSEFDLIL